MEISLGELSQSLSWDQLKYYKYLHTLVDLYYSFSNVIKQLEMFVLYCCYQIHTKYLYFLNIHKMSYMLNVTTVISVITIIKYTN